MYDGGGAFAGYVIIFTNYMKRYLFIFILVCFSCKHTNPKKWEVLYSLKNKYANREIHIAFGKSKPKSDTTKDFYIYFSKTRTERVCKMSKDSNYRVSVLEYYTKDKKKTKAYKPSDFVYIESFGKKFETTNNGFIPYYYIQEFNEVAKYDE